MSTYKSLAGPPGGLLVSTDAEVAERAITLAEWREFGSGYAKMMVDCARAMAESLDAAGVPVFRCGDTFTDSHAFALDARSHGGGERLAIHLRQANILTSAIGLPTGTDDGLRLGLNELVRWGATVSDMAALADLVARAATSSDPASLAEDVRSFRGQFTTVHFAL